MVDSSIGGKTGVNTKHGKNLIGTIWQPAAVLIDTDFLNTLPTEEFLSGLAEIVKLAAIRDKELFRFIETNREQILKKNMGQLLHIIKRSIELKKEIVEKDETEKNLRMLLNFGHTIGHGIEAASDFSISHGFAVSIGMVIESKISVKLGILPEAEEKRLQGLLTSLGLPVKLPENIQAAKIINKIKADKKNIDKDIRMVVIDNIGSCIKDIVSVVDEKTIEGCL